MGAEGDDHRMHKEEYMSRQSDKNKTKQIRIDADFHRKLKIEAAQKDSSIRDLLEKKAGWDSGRHDSESATMDEKIKSVFDIDDNNGQIKT